MRAGAFFAGGRDRPPFCGRRAKTVPTCFLDVLRLYLKCIELQGFKSFPDKTVIRFGGGITAIVGPNGSGKSNIADAIRWVLGEQSSKTLRGTKMEDVVFDGTAERKAQGFAEVSLTVDNSDGRLPLSYEEITVSRRYYRSGESEYLINRVPVRLRDVHELFMDTGLGRDGYSIIGQGRIAEILSVRSEDRRQIFEEAAGISKYRYRKAEAERKLMSTEENLVRLRDILAELESRVEPLREQSEKARRFLELSGEKKALEISLWLHSIDAIRSGMDKLESELSISRNDLERAEEELSALAKSIDEAFERASRKTAEIEAVRGEQSRAAEEGQRRESEIALLRNNAEHLERQISELDEAIAAERAGADSIEAQLAECRARAESLAARRRLEEEELARAIAEADELVAKAEAFSGEMTGLRRAADAARESATALRIRQSAAQSADVSWREQLEKLKSEAEARERAIDELESARKALVRSAAEKNERLDGLKNVIKGYELKVKAQKEKNERAAAELSKLRAELSELLLRRDTLADMERHFEGFAHSVKAVMQQAGRGGLSGILGPVSSLLRVDEKYATAIETALGGSLQNIVTRTEDDAKRAIEYLKSTGQGRATFLPVSAVKGQTLSASEFKDFPGFVGIAKTLVRYDATYDGVFSSLLGRVAVVETLDDAVAIARRTGYRHRIVTLDGQLMSPGGSMTGGSAARNSGILTRQGEIERLTAQAKSVKKRVDEAEAAYRQACERVQADEAYLDGANAEYRTAAEELAADRAMIDRKEFELGELAERARTEADEAARIERARCDIQAELKSIEAELSGLEAQIAQAEERYGALAAGHSDLEELRRAQGEAIAERRMALMATDKDIEAEARAAAELEERRAQQEDRAGRELERKAELISSREALLADIARRESERDAFAAKLAGFEERIAALLREREKCEQETVRLRQNEKEKQSRRDLLMRETERLENRRLSVMNEYDSLVARLWDEYELTVSEAESLRVALDGVTKAQKRLGELRQAIKALGNVNVGAIEEYKQVRERYDFLRAQTEDLVAAKRELERIIDELTAQMRGIFTEQFSVINKEFASTFAELFGGGTAELSLTDPSDVLSSGIDIKVAPPGKIIKNLSSLSGGEQAFVAIALYFAIIKVRPTPFCVLDEIEAALDEVNVTRFAAYLRKLVKNTQFIAITHRRGTMEEADMLYGVTMQEKGVSKLLAINVNEVAEKLKL